MVYFYAGLVLERATGGDARILAVILLIWGIAGPVGNVVCVDRFPSRTTVNIALWAAVANFCVLPWTSAHIVGAAVALTVWGFCGSGLIVPQQHRLVEDTVRITIWQSIPLSLRTGVPRHSRHGFGAR